MSTQGSSSSTQSYDIDCSSGMSINNNLSVAKFSTSSDQEGAAKPCVDRFANHTSEKRFIRDPRLVNESRNLSVDKNIPTLPSKPQDEFTVVRARNNKRKAEKSSNDLRAGKRLDSAATAFPLSNAYDVLSDNSDMEDDSSTTEPKPPPVFIPSVSNLQLLLNIITSNGVNKTDYVYKIISRSQMKLNASNSRAYSTIIKNLKSSKIDFHTYQLKQCRAFRVVLRHVHYSVDVNDVIQELATHNHAVRNISNIRHRITKEPLSLFFVDLEPASNNRDIYKIELLQNAKIKFEPPYQKNDIIQCKRCQRYGHSRAYCNRPFRCVKCGDNHDTTICGKQKDAPPLCALCGGDHPSNYKGCEIYKQIKQRKFPPLRERTVTPPETQTVSSKFVTQVVAKNSVQETLHQTPNGLPNDLFVYWQQYPWPFGVFLCKLRAFISEMTSYTSVLTIVAFSMERYLAICHPLHSYAMSGLHRAVRIIAVLWLVSLICAAPFAVFSTLNYIDYPPRSGIKMPESAICAMLDTYNWPVIEMSGLLFFFIPMFIIIVLYTRIGLRIRERSRYSLGKRVSGTVHDNKSRKSIIRMLLAVVMTFFLCWAPFHLQRLLYIYAKGKIPDALYLNLNEWLYYITGILYFFSSTANPILYNVMSVKYRKAFRQTLCCTRTRHTDLNSSFRDTLTNDSPKFTRTMTWKNSMKSQTTDLVVRITPSNNGRGKCMTTVRAATKRWPKTLLRVTMSPQDEHICSSVETEPQTEIDVEAKLCCDNSSSGGSVCIEMETCI